MQFTASTTNATTTSNHMPTNSVWGRKRNIDDLLVKLSNNSANFSSLNIMSTRTIKTEDIVKLQDILINENDTLTELYASGHSLDSTAIEIFATILENNKKLKLLSIGNVNFGNNNLSILCKGLERNNGLETLDLEYKGLNGKVDAENLFMNLTKAINSPSSTMENINLSRNSLYNEGLLKLTNGLITNGGIGKLNFISLCDIECSGGKGIVPFGNALVKSFNEKKRFENVNESSEENDEKKRNFLKLDLSRNLLFGSVGCSAFISTGILNVVSELSLDGCNIGNLGLDTIARAFIYNGIGNESKIMLNKLSIRGNNITSIGILNLIDALLCSKNIISDLDFGNNKCGDEAFHKLFYLNGLKKLCLLGNGINDDNIYNLEQQLENNNDGKNTAATNTSTCALEYLDLCGNDITDVGSNMLCNSFVNNIIQTNNDNNVVKTLVLGSNPGISQNGIAAIEEINKNYSQNIRVLYDIGANSNNNNSSETNATTNDRGNNVSSTAVEDKKSTTKPFTYYLSPYESSRVEKAINDNFTDLFEKSENIYDNHNNSGDEEKQITKAKGLDFVWIHTLSKENYEIRMSSTVCSQIAGIEVLENKANLALLCQDLTEATTLESYVVHGKDQFLKWCKGEQRKMKKCIENNENYNDGWIAKDSTANGGEGLYQFTIKNEKFLQKVQDQIDDATEYVVQRYVNKPLLWEGKYKFHFRVYCVLNANMEFFAYRKAFAHVCNKEYIDINEESDEYDPEIHISNVAANIHDESYFHNYPTVDLPTEFPNLWLKMQNTMKSIIRKGSTFMQYQTSENNFMLIGADFIPDANGNIWLLELNCPPCMAAYQGADEEALESNKFEQAIRPLVSSVVRDVINDFVIPILYRKTYKMKDTINQQHFIYGRSGNFMHLNDDDDVINKFKPSIANGAKDLSKNTLSWKVYKWRMGKRMKKMMNA